MEERMIKEGLVEQAICRVARIRASGIGADPTETARSGY